MNSCLVGMFIILWAELIMLIRVIDSCHSAVKYFFHYNYRPNLNNCTYFKFGCSNFVKHFGIKTAIQTIWYFIHVNRTLLKIWPHLTFAWPLANITLTKNQRHNNLYIFVILKRQRAMIIWHTWKNISSIFEIWPQINPYVTPTGEGVYCLKLSNSNDFKTTTNSISSK